MSEEKLCRSCNEEIEDGAVYCGNCGVKLTRGSLAKQVYENGSATTTAIALNPASPNIPAYATNHDHHKQHWAALALAFGILAVCGGLLIPILGVSFAVIGIVLSTSSLRITHGWLKSSGLIVPVIALLFSLGVYVNALNHSPKVQEANQAATSDGVATISVTTPCYTLTFGSELNVNNSSGSCSMNAYNGTALGNSSSIFKVVASQTTNVSITNFDSLAKQAIETDISKNLPGFSITSEQSNLFDGSPAYIIQAYNQSSNVAFSEEVILHSTSSGKDNYFDIVHATNGQSASLANLQKTWQWND
ncbi:MAG TPA: zinc ribbon domain-containing protein [Candidatus Saccharimonadales bacterium]|jgi:hypothetical protein